MTAASDGGGTAEGTILWRPSAERARRSGLAQFRTWAAERTGQAFPDYKSLHRWSVEEPEAFWMALWDYFRIEADGQVERVLEPGEGMFKARWFQGARLNYAEHLLRRERTHPGDRAIGHASEDTPELQWLTYSELGERVRTVAEALRALGVTPGDRVASYMPNIPETAIAMIATAAIGAVWSAAAPEFGAQTVIDRFAQIGPKVLFATDGYRFGGKQFDRRGEVERIAEQLPGLEVVVHVPLLGLGEPPRTSARLVPWTNLLAGPAPAAADFRFERVGWDHPLWVLYSSGTTGIPKAIVHSHHGPLIEHFKTMSLHLDLHAASRVFIYTTPGWMMWNVVVSTMLVGGCAVLFDGAPNRDGPETLWRFAEKSRCTLFGASPSFIQMTGNAGIVPRTAFDLSALEALILGGSPSGPDIYGWIYRNVKDDVWACAPSGGTEIVSGFVTGDPTAPVRAGEIQALGLGMEVQVWDDNGQPVIDLIGELVVTKPFPSAPLCFWNDAGDRRYHESYFEYFPGVWRHGDLARITPHGGCYIYGRSDSTLNRFGVRIGTSEIYSIVERVEGVRDSLVVCCDRPDGSFYMPLFVALDSPREDTALEIELRRRLRSEGSPRHVPDEILIAPAIPYTITGKRLEVPIRKLLMGAPADSIVSRDALAVPAVLDWYIDFAARLRERSEPAA